MSWPTRTRNFCMRLGVYLYLSCVCRYWSRLYRFLFEGRYEYYQVNTYDDWASLVENQKRLQYKSDGPKQLWDAISYPGKTQHALDTQESPAVGDCDEFAMYLVHAIKRSTDTGKMGPYIIDQWKNYKLLHAIDARFLTVVWKTASGSMGHNVCLIDWFQPSTGDELYSFMDYDKPSHPWATIREVIDSVIDKYTDEFSVCLGWAIHDKDLNLLEVHWK